MSKFRSDMCDMTTEDVIFAEELICGLLSYVLADYIKSELGGTTERAEILAAKLIEIMDGE